MGVRLIVEVLDRYHGEAHRKLWLAAFAESANDKTRQGWPPREELASRADVSPSRASNIATALIGEGVLRRDRGGNRSGPAKYTLLELTPVGVLKKGSPKTHSSGPGKGSPSTNPQPQVKGSRDPGKGSRSTPQPAETGSLPLKSIPLINTPPARKRAEYDDPAWREFWLAYPRKTAKRTAWRAWLSAMNRDADPAAVVKAAIAYATERGGQDPNYTKHPATWLNGDCWLDERERDSHAEREWTGWQE